MKTDSSFYKFLLLLILFLGVVVSSVSNSASAPAKNCEQALIKKADIAEKFGYSYSVLEQIRKHKPDIYEEMVSVFLGIPSRFTQEDLMAENLSRGMEVLPEEYDPEFMHNTSGGNTKHGISWFSYDSATANDYARPSSDMIREFRRKAPKYLGLTIHVEVPAFLVVAATESSFRAGSNVALDRAILGNESVYISSVSLMTVDYKKKSIGEEIVSYNVFRKRFLDKSKFRRSFLF